MSLSKWIFSLVLILWTCTLWAQEKPNRVQTHYIGVSYLSWKENVDLKLGSATDHTTADVYGNLLLYQFESYAYQAHSGYLIESVFGTGSVGVGASERLAYKSSQLKWWGLVTSLRYSYRLTSAVAASAGPLIVYRNFELPTDAAGIEAASGAPFNYGFLLHLRLSLSKTLEINQSVGGLLDKASTYWNLGIAYKL